LSDRNLVKKQLSAAVYLLDGFKRDFFAKMNPKFIEVKEVGNLIRDKQTPSLTLFPKHVAVGQRPETDSTQDVIKKVVSRF
jgi:hypothetical protein